MSRHTYVLRADDYYVLFDASSKSEIYEYIAENIDSTTPQMRTVRLILDDAVKRFGMTSTSWTPEKVKELIMCCHMKEGGWAISELIKVDAPLKIN